MSTNLNILGLGAPGTQFQVNTDEQVRAALPRTSEVAFCVGLASWGPLNMPTDVSAGSFRSLFGPLRAGASLAEFFGYFFNNYGRRGKAIRIAGAGAAAPTVTLVDQLGVDTLTITAKHPTEEPIFVLVEPGTLANTRKITVEAPTLGYTRKSYDNFKLTFTADEQAAIDAGTSPLTTLEMINQHSPLVDLVDEASGSAAPDNLPVNTSEVQIIAITGSPDAGTITPAVTRNSVTLPTAPLAHDSTAAQVRAALEALANVGAGNVVVSGAAGGPYTVAFQGALANENIAPISVTHALTGGTSPGVTVSTSREGGALALAGGDNGFAGVSDATYIGAEMNGVKTGLQAFNDEDLGKGQVSLYGVTTAAARNALFAHCQAYARIAVPDLPFAISVADAIALRRAHDTSYGALYFPTDVEAFDLTGSGLKKLLYTSPFVCGVFAEAERREGIGRAPANIPIPGALRVGTTVPGGVQIDASLQAALAEAQLNAIRSLPNRGVTVYDAWVLRQSGRVLMIHEQRVLNSIVHDLRLTFKDVEFRVNDGGRRLMREVESVTKQYLRSLGDRVLVSYAVRCDSSNNNATTMAAQQLFVDVAVHIVGSARQIIIRLNSMSSGTEVELLEAA